MDNNIAIHFNFLKRFNLTDRKRLKNFLGLLLSDHQISNSEINYIFCSDADILKINQDFLNHNYYTDIITFNLSESPDQLVAEIYISIDTVKTNSQLLKTNFIQEIHRVIFHGLLHLCGYNDKSDHERRIMRSKEDYYLDLYKTFHVEQ